LRYHEKVKFFLASLAFSIPALFAQITLAQLTPGAPARPAAPALAPPPATTTATDPNKVVLSVGDLKITAAQYDDIINSLPAQAQASIRGMGKRAFGERIAELMVLSQEAEKRKLDQQPKLKEQISFQRENLLAQAMYEELQKGLKIDDAAVEKYYSEHKSEFEVLKGRHILIRVKGAPMQAIPGKPELSDEEALAKAQSIRKRLEAGEDFATLAKAESDDTGSNAQGGDLGEFRKGMMIPPIEEAAWVAKVGVVTDPVKTPLGYHLIKIESHVTKPMAEVRADIETKLRPDLANAAVAAMRKSATVQIDEGYFGPSAPAVPNGGLGGATPLSGGPK
jgi:parvulin-like peptidyl-prolyl isomerase